MEGKIGIYIKKLISTGFVHIFGANTLNQVLSFLSSIVLVRVLTKADYGCFSNALNIYQFFLLLSGLGISSGILQMCSEYSDNPEKSNKIYAWSSTFGIKVNVVLSVCILIVGLFIPISIEGTNELLVCFCALPIFTLVYEMSIAKMRGDIKAKEYSYSNIVNMVLYCGLSILGAIIMASKGLILGRYLAYLLTSIFIAIKFHVFPSFKKVQLDSEIKTPLLKVSLISVVNNGLSTLFNLLEVFILGIVISDSTVTASYKVATTIPTALNFIPQAFAVYVYPYFAKHIANSKWIKRNYLRSLLGLGIIDGVIAFVLIAIAEPLVNIVFGVQYADSINLFKILVVGYFIGGTFRVLSGNLLVSQRKLLYNTVVAVIGCVISIMANVILIPIYGSFGAACAHICVLTITGILNTGGMLYFINNKKKKGTGIETV